MEPVVHCRCLKHGFWCWGSYRSLFDCHKVDLPFFFILSLLSSLLESWYHMPLLLQVFISCPTFSNPFLSEHFGYTDTLYLAYIFLTVVGRGDKHCSCVWTWVTVIVCVLLTVKPCFLLALLSTAVCNFPSFVPFKLLKKESIQKAIMSSWFLNFLLSFFFLTSQADSLWK